jgi:DNA repair exonuclease SbcCD nuclease subunit
MKAATSPSSGPARPLRVLHTADVHLDSDSYASGTGRRTHRELLRRAFRAIVDMARSEAVDLVLIAGDLFDHNRVGDETVAFVQGELRRAGRPVVVLPGNHDCLNAGAIYDRHDFAAGSGLVRVVSAFDGEAVEFPGLQVVVWGRGMQDHEPAFHPLDHLPARGSARWHIAMAHGFFHGDGGRVERSSPIFGEEIRDTGWDYVALGHHHVPADVSRGGVVACYPGAPIVDWRGKSAAGQVALVELSPERGVTVESRTIVLDRSDEPRG